MSDLEKKLATMVSLRDRSVGVDLRRANYAVARLESDIRIEATRRTVVHGQAGTKAHLSLEEYLDEEFWLLGVELYIYHIQPIEPHPHGAVRAVTIASVAAINVEAVRSSLFSIEMLYWRLGRRRSQSIASFMKQQLEQQLEADGCAGIAVCDYRDQFSRKRGRIIAKGRLRKVLRAEGSFVLRGSRCI